MARKSVTDLFTRTNEVRVMGTPEVYSVPGDRRIEWHIYDSDKGPALVSYGAKNHPGVRPGVHGIFTGGTKEDYRNWLTEGRYKKVDKSYA